MDSQLQAQHSPFPAFRFEVTFEQQDLSAGAAQNKAVVLGRGAFSECAGLEATMEPKSIEEGGLNYGAHQRVGRVHFNTVILKRGMTVSRDLWFWFQNVQMAYAHRLTVTVTFKDQAGTPQWAWRLERCLPVKFKAADLNASGAEVAIEELHLVHEGLGFEAFSPKPPDSSSPSTTRSTP